MAMKNAVQNKEWPEKKEKMLIRRLLFLYFFHIEMVLDSIKMSLLVTILLPKQ